VEKQDVSKTDRILLTLGEEIVSGQFVAPEQKL
jgi:GntR family galactonate operon transcriptional repressor